MNLENPTTPEIPGSNPAPRIDEPCRTCAPFIPAGDKREVGCGPMKIMTEREITVLGAMRKIKKEVLKIKRRRRLAEEDLQRRVLPNRAGNTRHFEIREKLRRQGLAEDILYFNQRLALMKEQWQEMDHERTEAANERMRLLGHRP